MHQSQDESKLQYNIKNPHQISQGHLPTVNQIQEPENEEMRTTQTTIRPIVSKRLPAPFVGVPKVSSIKAFAKYRENEQKRQTDNFMEHIDSKVQSEDYKALSK